MAGFRLGKATEDIRRELSDILRSVKDPRVSGLLSIVKIDLSGDMSYCKVYVSSLEGMESTRQSVKGLTSTGLYPPRARYASAHPQDPRASVHSRRFHRDQRQDFQTA